MTILVVDDEPTYRYLVADYLEGQHWTVLTAGDGVQALEVLRKADEIDIIISDVYMPVMDGLRFFKTLREVERFKDLPFLFVSAYDDDFTLSAVKACSNAGFLKKGKPMVELLNWIGSLTTPLEKRDRLFPSDKEMVGTGNRSSTDVACQSGSGKRNGTGSKRILLVDDDQNFLTILAHALTDEGYTVNTLTDAEDAILAAQDTKFDLVLLDLRMPAIDGIATLKFIKQYAPQTKVIVLTAYFDNDLLTQSKSLGAEGVIAKQHMDRDLPVAIRRALSVN